MAGLDVCLSWIKIGLEEEEIRVLGRMDFLGLLRDCGLGKEI